MGNDLKAGLRQTSLAKDAVRLGYTEKDSRAPDAIQYEKDGRELALYAGYKLQSGQLRYGYFTISIRINPHGNRELEAYEKMLEAAIDQPNDAVPPTYKK